MLKKVALAARDAAAVVGLGALLGFYGVERALVWLVPASILVAGIFYCCYRIRCYYHKTRSAGARRRVPMTTGRKVREEAQYSHAVGVGRSGSKYHYVLTEGGVPIRLETSKAVANRWLDLGPEADFAVFSEQGEKIA
jgi:hypothetical protein